MGHSSDCGGGRFTTAWIAPANESLADVIATKLMALNEQEPDPAPVLEIARSLREQIDWDFVRARTEQSPFARAFFTLVEELGIVEPEAA